MNWEYVHRVWALAFRPRKQSLGAQTLCIVLLLLAATTHPSRADCPAAPIADPDDMAISFLKANGVQAASASLLASSVKEGTLVYDDTAKKLKVCDGDNWIEVGSGSGGSSEAAGDEGQIQFNDGSDAFAADPALHWDNTNKRLGIGTATPGALLHLGTATPVLRFKDTDVSGVVQLYQSGSMFAIDVDPTNVDASSAFSVAIDGTAHLRMTSTGNVGLGTTAPATKLDVDGVVQAGGIRISDPGASGWVGQLQWRSQDASTLNHLFYQNRTDNDTLNLYLKYSGSTATANFNILGGNVGIGTTGPSHRLDVYGTIRGASSGAGDALIIGNDGKLVDINVANTVGLYGLQNDAVGSLKLGSGGPVVSGANGNFGVGTADPHAKTEIYGTGQLTSALADSGSRDAILAINANAAGGGNGGAITFGNTQSKSANSLGFAAIKGFLDNGAGNTIGGLAFSTRESSSDTALTERVRIARDGNVGIGTANPLGKLHINAGANADTIITGWSSSNADIDGLLPGTAAGSLIRGGDLGHMVLGLRDNDTNDGFYVLSGGGNYNTDTTYDTVVLAAKADGKVGIGTSAPTSRLHVIGGALFDEQAGDGAAIKITERSTQYGGKLAWLDDTQAFSAVIGKTANDSLAFYTGGLHGNGQEKMVLTSTGNVGIGTATPRTLLDLYSDSVPVRLRMHPGTTTANAAGMFTGFAHHDTMMGSYLGGGLSHGFISTGYANSGRDFSIGTATGSTFTTATFSPVLTVVDNGNVGIGMASPGSPLHVVKTGGGTNIALGATYANFGEMYSSASTVIGNNVKVSEGASASLINVNTHATYAGSAIVVNGNTGIHFHTKSGAATAGAAYSSERMMIAPNGNVAFYGRIGFQGTPNGTGSFVCSDSAAGWYSTMSSYCAPSDGRLKKKVVSLEDGALESILKLRPLSYEWKDEKRGKRREIGFVAQEVEKIFPLVVNTSDDAMGTKSVDYPKLVSPMVKAIQEFKILFDTFKADMNVKFNQHDAEIKTLQADNDNLLAELKAANDNDAAQDAAIRDLYRELQLIKGHHQ